MKFQFSFLLVFLSSTVLAQLTTVKVNHTNNNPNEPSVAINPFSTKTIVAAANINNFYFSRNRGTTWIETTATSEFGVYGDPVLHYSDSQLFFTHLSKTKGKGYGDWFDRIVVQEIKNFNPWQETSYSVGYNNNKMQDKPWLSSDDFSKKFKGNKYVTWTEFDVYDSKDPKDRSRIRFSKKGVNDKSFTDAITISDITGDCQDGDSTLEGATTAVGKNGEIYVVWAGLNKIWFDKSLDGGKTWGTDQILADQAMGWDMDMPNIHRANGMPFIGCYTESNRIYITWADEKNGDADIWLLYSLDGGRTWSDRFKLNTDDSEGNQYFPNLTIDQKTGDVYVAYYDQRHSSKQFFYDIYLSKINATQPQKINNYRITEQSIPLPGSRFFYGDYLDLDIAGNQIAIAYPKYTLLNISEIEMAYGNLIDLTLNPERIDPFTSNIAFEKDSLSLVVNAQNKARIDVKIRYGSFFNGARQRYKSTLEPKENLSDFVISSYGKTNKIKYRLRIIDLNTGNIHKIRKQFSF